ncbi:MAG: sulfurtransferase-like selenium metabolism protein YedF [Bacteroidales bacterium]
MKTIDTRGMLCPAPLIHTKRAIKDAREGEMLEVLLDNETACQNVAAYLKELGINTDVVLNDKVQHVRFTVPSQVDQTVDAASFCNIQETSNYVVVLKSQLMGEGDPQLGALLMRAFINSLKEVDQLPTAIILYNSGVKLAVDGTDTAASLAEMENKGVTIVCCGTCVDFYELKPMIKIGAISNMFRITQLTSKAGNVVYP